MLQGIVTGEQHVHVRHQRALVDQAERRFVLLEAELFADKNFILLGLSGRVSGDWCCILRSRGRETNHGQKKTGDQEILLQSEDHISIIN